MVQTFTPAITTT